ncbi:MAG: class I SAM-dependent methyltransferase [Lachnospiraceae bacterium]|nr:class I SAM-dependent methyltransferase [Lachnospiraceae bacterium]
MESYQDFAYVYDEFMDETPYDLWCERIDLLIKKYGISEPKRDAKEALESEKNLVLDLGCGTGTLTEMLYAKGYDMIGIDNSDSMLSIAMGKKEVSGSEILYLLQDMRELELYSTVGTVISVCDSINYILDEEELLEVFLRVNNYLYPGGIFIFDFNTDYKYREIIGDTVIAENRDNCSFIWENYYDEDEKINEYDVTVFVKEEGELFRKFEETHFQKGYTKEKIENLLKRAGMNVLSMKDADTDGEVTGESQRIYVVAKECQKG